MSNEVFLRRDCPVCKRPPSAVVEASSTIRAEDMPFESLIPHWNGFFKEKVYFSYVRCEQCGLLYAPCFFTPSQLENLYGQMPPNMAEVPLSALQRTQGGYFSNLVRCSPLKGGFIEIGPDIGLFTGFAARNGSFDEFWLFEPNRDVAGQLAHAVEGKTHHIIHEMTGFSNVPDSAVSVAVMIHVLDHLLDPVATLRELRRKLAPDARLLIVTHDESSLLRKVVDWRWPAFCLQHPQIYNPRSITRLLNAAGFDVVQRSKTTNYFQFGFLIKHLLWALGLKARSIPFIGQFTVGLKLGNILTIATPSAEAQQCANCH